MFVPCLQSSAQVDWSGPFALLAQRPPDFVANVELPVEPTMWLQGEGLSDVEQAPRQYLNEWQQGSSARAEEGDASLGEHSATASLRAALRDLANVGSGIRAGVEPERSAKELWAGLTEFRDSDDSTVMEAVLSGIRRTYATIRSDTELDATRQVLLGRMYSVVASRQGRLDEALVWYDRALGAAPRLSDVWYEKGATLKALERPEEAIHCFDQALEIDPEFKQARGNKGHTLMGLGRAEALDCLERAEQLGDLQAAEILAVYRGVMRSLTGQEPRVGGQDQ